MNDGALRVARVIPATRAEGPGLRYAIWTQGCELRCPGCCNPELFADDAGVSVEVDALHTDIAEAHRRLSVEGITLVGGEPLEQLESVAELCARVRGSGLGVILYTGYTVDEAAALPGYARLWPMIDTLVTGRFDAGRLEEHRAFVGSTNQRLIHRTDRYRDHPQWLGPGATEVRIEADGRLTVIGMPRAVRRLSRALEQHAPPIYASPSTNAAKTSS